MAAAVEGGDVPVAIGRHSITGRTEARSVLLMHQKNRSASVWLCGAVATGRHRRIPPLHSTHHSDTALIHSSTGLEYLYLTVAL